MGQLCHSQNVDGTKKAPGIQKKELAFTFFEIMRDEYGFK
jgi:hypothetical protein